ncbi:hypothetical protein [Nitrosomonas sp. Is37]|uniref:hypothetical protein n=1 Tax=Nitrosomonas sp. Is37 TaxID=3080535 RepID=UPI00294B0912|nr:hypothetical protein [Nitrosomonas sp. Is37]MDV6345558.1 hypothetical protein [Nitrosomonas sp. Is37]
MQESSSQNKNNNDLAMFKIYLRDNKQRIYRSLATDDKFQAMEAFDTMIYRKDLDGKKIIAILLYRNSYVAFYRFDVPSDHKNNLRGKTKDIYKSLLLI